MRRREFIVLLGGAAALAPFGAIGQPGLPIIGYLSSRSAGAETPLRNGFLEGLEQAGWPCQDNRTAREGGKSRLTG